MAAVTASYITQTYTAAAKATIFTAYGVGLVLFLVGLYTAYKYSTDPQRFPIRRAVTTGLAGMLLMAAPIAATLIMASLDTSQSWTGLSGGIHSALAIDQSALKTGSASQTFLEKFIPHSTVLILIGFIYLVGVLNFLRGLYLLKNIGEQNPNHQSGTARALTHILGGLACIHISIFVPAIAAFFRIS